MAETIASQAVDLINRVGIFDVLVPFIIGSAALYGMLEKSQVFGKDRHDVNAMVSIGIGILVALSWATRMFLLNFIPIVIILAFFVFVVVLVLEWLGVDPKQLIGMIMHPGVFIPLLLVIFVLIMLAMSGGLDVMLGRTNYTGAIGVPTGQETPEDFANPLFALAQPEVAGAVLILAILAVITYMITQKR
jgi:hypothetical protein